MTEQEAKAWLSFRWPKAGARLARYVELLISATSEQNLISRTTIDHVWARHIVDSAQLLELAPAEGRRWLDIGSGAGLPGIVIALLSTRPVTLVEPRRKRADFLTQLRAHLPLENVEVVAKRVEAFQADRYDVITARAFTNLEQTLASASHLSDARTTWLLPKGRSASKEVEALDHRWQGVFHVKPSLTDVDAGIVVANGVRRSLDS